MVEGAGIQKDYVALAETHNSPIPTLHLQRDFPFTVNTVKMGKSGKKNFSLWEKCVISSLRVWVSWGVWENPQLPGETKWWRWAFWLSGLPSSCAAPGPDPLLSPSCYCSFLADLGRDAFQKSTCYLHFPSLERSFPCL